MRLSQAATAVSALLLLPTVAFASIPSGLQRRQAHHDLAARAPSGNFNQLYLASNYQNGSTAPGATATDAPGQQVVVGGTGDDDDSQRPGCTTIFINSAAVGGSDDNGWTEIPELVGFYVDRNLTYSKGTATFPVYVETGKDFSKVKRVIVGQPGKPRDAWKYANLFRNSLLCAVANSSMAVDLSDVLVTAPIYITEVDRQAGMGEDTDVYYSNGGWNVGSKASGPGNADPSAFDALDDIVTRFANQTEFPALTSIIIAGHSLGASIANRYSMLRNVDTDTDALVSFWSGNPGAYVWPSASRPVTPSNTSCASQVDDWAYGVSGTLPAYVKGKPSADVLYARFRSRIYQFALGLLDDGPGDTHCEAQYQGSTHLERGQNLQKALNAMSGGTPSGMSFNYVPNTSHQDYKMMADANSQEYLFVTNLTNARPAGTETTSSATASSKGGSSKKSSTNSAGATSGARRTMATGVALPVLFSLIVVPLASMALWVAATVA